ncbi:hypothetical protein FJZ33_00165 [Candidatus Poribacteria bacterium]|nr:hypothetical protein [Candidatus Poribacteria bacterium]
MKIKLRDLFGARDIFKKIFNEPMNVKLSYRLSKISNKINSELMAIEKQRIALVEKYADFQTEEEKKKRAPKEVKEKLEDFIKEFDTLLETEEEIDIQPIPSDLLFASDIKLSSNELDIIKNFIQEEKDEKV